ncbi:hypothetical protein BaRGS_00018660, partial [Batillaria attramentaria]
VQFVAVVHNGVMAIDDVMFYNTTCPSEGGYTHGAVADMSNKSTGWFTDLVIHLTCTQTNYTITIKYRIKCMEGMCMIVILHNVDGQMLPLWNTTDYSHDIQTKTVPVPPRGTNSSISIQAWKNNNTGWSFEVILETVTLKKSGIATSATDETTRISETPNAITSTPGTTSQRRHVDIETTASEPNADALDRSADENEASNDSDNGLAIDLGVSVAVVAVVVLVVVVIIVIIRRKGSDGNTGGFTGILNRWRKKQKPETTPDILKLGEMNSTYSPEMRPENELPAPSGVDNTYAKVNKPKPQDVYSVPQKGPKTASKPRSTSNCGRPHETRDQSDAVTSDYYSTAAAATGRNDRKPKVDNGYVLAAAVQSTAVYSTPRNTPKQNAETTPSNVKTDDEQDGEYNTISHQPLRAAPGTNQVYDHVGKKDQGAPTDTDRSNEYSLARPAANVSSASTGNVQKRRDYVNVDSSATTTLPSGEEEYNSLHFDHGRSSSAAVTDRDEEGGHAVYNHLQGDEEYNSLQFDGRGQGQQSGEDIDNMYSHIVFLAKKNSTPQRLKCQILVDDIVYKNSGKDISSSSTTITSTTALATTALSDGYADANDSDNGLAIGLGVSVAAVAVVILVVVVIIVIIRRGGSDGNNGGCTGILNRRRKKQEPDTTPDILKLGETNSTYSHEMPPENDYLRRDRVNPMSQGVSGSHDAAARRPNICVTSSGYVEMENGSFSERSRDCGGSGYITLDDAADSTDNQDPRQARENIQKRNITARLLTPEFPVSPTDVCLQFLYRSGGFSTGTLNVTIVTSNQESENSVLWSSSNRTGNDWDLVHVTLSDRRLTQPFQLAFDGNIAYSGKDSGLAVDNLRTAPGSCPKHGDCSFEVICPSWHQYDNTTANWTHGYSPGNSPEGPYDDHTFGNHHGTVGGDCVRRGYGNRRRDVLQHNLS